MQSKTIFRPFSTFEYLKTIDKKKKNFFFIREASERDDIRLKHLLSDHL